MTAEQALTEKSRMAADSSCLGSQDPECRIVAPPLRLRREIVKLPGRDAAFRRMASPLTFFNRDARSFVAPQDTLTDGASIPPLFIPLVGPPDSPEFAVASALHDAYCGIGNEDGPSFHADTWQAVHIMFYDALVDGGADPVRAKVMFAAVWLGGPRWGEPWRDLGEVPDALMYAVMSGTIDWIEDTDPSIFDIILRLERQERLWLMDLRRQARLDRQDEQVGYQGGLAGGL